VSHYFSGLGSQVRCVAAFRGDAIGRNEEFPRRWCGLDEYDADSIGKRQLADFVGGMTASTKVKIVLASRPEAPLESVFDVGLRCPTLRLEALTKKDISSYVAARLWKNPSLPQFSGIEENLAYEIQSYVIDNAKGVFLWVTLVMDIVIDGIDHHDDFQTIKQRVTDLPPELDDLFSHILLRRISDHHRTEPFRCLFMVLEWHRNHPEGLLPPTAVDVGQQATSYEMACSLAAISGEDARRKTTRRIAYTLAATAFSSPITLPAMMFRQTAKAR
jgi:hypothetical protein